MGDRSAPDLEFFLPHSNVDDEHGGRRFSDSSDGVEEAEFLPPPCCLPCVRIEIFFEILNLRF
ncbi:hypothetical protein TIFTF001_024783 [Ficus carica]|uniref:Uncharacterized protein n=1 Tax=Ficus carica TaxID=3494 RepID=A0AA88AN03_FICCA|nr:hypothetical protein TIFTF001_024783 [Ficus carica]